MRDFWLAGICNILPLSPDLQLVGMKNVSQCVLVSNDSPLPLRMLPTQASRTMKGPWCASPRRVLPSIFQQRLVVSFPVHGL